MVRFGSFECREWPKGQRNFEKVVKMLCFSNPIEKISIVKFKVCVLKYEI